MKGLRRMCSGSWRFLTHKSDSTKEFREQGGGWAGGVQPFVPSVNYGTDE